ncbi:MAG: tRNA epoxyqueuosine(34) reductase QueG [Bacteroidetes bacterium]|nr:tRNA epoxyqueuosine(34) reductase QueG [Bacteroidota bacterium]
MSDLKMRIKTEALRLGFSHCGVAQNDTLEQLRPFYSAFIGRNGHAGMQYLETNFEKRLHPELVVPDTKSVIALLWNYYPPEIIPEEDNFIISKYAYGVDYHGLVRNRLNELINFMKLSCGNIRAGAFVDSGAVLEKAWAQKCGVGWQGKNTLIINKTAGSFFFIGIILTDLILEPDTPETDHCGTCRNCAEACPTGALDTSYQLDIPRCISYLTIESREEIPAGLRSNLNDRIYGCDICQDVCPYNRFATPHQTPAFLPSEPLMNLRKKDWIALSETDFNTIFEKSPVKRAGYRRLMHVIQMPPPIQT